MVATKNEEKNIETCLRSLRAQTFRDIEILVVDNRSEDKTTELARRYTSKVYTKGPGLAAQRNVGIQEAANSEFLMFIDADMILSPGLIEACVRRMESRDCAALFIPEIVLGANFWNRVRRFERRFYDGTAIDGARLYRKDAVTRAGGFDENERVVNSVEDWDFDQKIKRLGAIRLLEDVPAGPPRGEWELASFVRARGVDPNRHGSVLYHNEADFDLRKYLQKKSYYAGKFDIYIDKWGRDNPDVRLQFGFWYRYFGVFIEQGKWRRLPAHPLLTSGMYFLRFLVGTIYLSRNLVHAKERPR
ncbi:MAG: hypothetical protein A2V88_07130 [Elusimicrobia bacterium RBG_16_66_12]|nr:MAG: hypothetical protein A2V88_07130 [Elusimicrobia bacterium RBG_16_66_12]